MNDPAIRAEDLTKYYGAVVGVENLSFEVCQGSVFGFLGANGAGKTTTIRLLLDLLRPSRGRVTVLGLDCRRDSLRARRQIGYLPGELPIYPDLTAAGYLDYLRRIDDRRVASDYLAELLNRFDVSGIDLRRRLRDQSHGMKQKIGIVQALMPRPPVVVLDEPTAGLDPLMVQAFRETVSELKKQGDTTVFLSSHVLADVESMCDRIGVIRGGRIVTTGTIDELRRNATRRVIVEFREPILESWSPPPGVTLHRSSEREWTLEVHGPLGPVIQAISTLPLLDIRIEPFKLEEYVARFYATNGAEQDAR